MPYVEIILGLIGGMGIFLYGMHLTSRGMQKMTVTRMKHYISSFTNNRFKGLLVGVLATFFLQSSTATSIIVVGLVGSSVISLWQAIGVVLGSSIGTTLTVQVLAFKITEFAKVFIFMGALFIIFSKRSKMRSLGQAIIGIGLLFLGIDQMSSSLEPLGTHEGFIHLMVTYVDKPSVLFLFSFILTILMHSSAATIVLAISLITAGALPFLSAIPIILGANLGSTIPALISSIASSREGKKIALSYFLFKLISIIIFFSLMGPLQKLVMYLPGNIERQIAHIHTLFNIGVALLFLPLTFYVAQVVDKIIPSKTEEDGVVFLDEGLIDIPEEALDKSKHEVLKLAFLVKNKMVCKIPDLFEGNTSEEEMFAHEKRIDESYIVIQRYLLKLGQQDLTESQSDKEVKLLYILNDLEHVGDIITKLAGISMKIREQNLPVIPEDWLNIKQMGEAVADSFTEAISSFEHNDLNKAREVINRHTTLIQLEKDLRFSHFNHLIEGKEYNSELSAVHLDVINHLLRINQHSVNISQTILGII